MTKLSAALWLLLSGAAIAQTPAAQPPAPTGALQPSAPTGALQPPALPSTAAAPDATQTTPQLPAIPQPPGPATPSWMPAGTAELRLMNKVDSHPITVMLPVGQQTTYGSLTITLKSCLVRPIDQIQDWAAYLDIVDSHQDEPSFHGWTLANEPWLGMLEHPVYDVRLIACH